MIFDVLDEAAGLVEKANANLEPELVSADAARTLLGAYARIKKLASFGEAALARKIDDASELARVTGTSVGKAKETVATGKVLAASAELNSALQAGDISLDQAKRRENRSRWPAARSRTLTEGHTADPPPLTVRPGPTTCCPWRDCE